MRKREDIYQALLEHGRGLKNEVAMAQMLASLLVGKGGMPAYLGFERETFEGMVDYYFPKAGLSFGVAQTHFEEMKRLRGAEKDELRTLLSRYCEAGGEEQAWVTDILVTGCMGNDHLWQDLGLWSRTVLKVFMEDNFPRLALKNEQDMKWKKFLYKQLCSQEGIYTCRSPSCEVCIDYANCFGGE